MEKLRKMILLMLLVVFAMILIIVCKDKMAETDSRKEASRESNIMYGEDEKPVSEIELKSFIAYGFYQGAAGITVSGKGKIYEITASDGCLGNYSLGFHKTSTISVSTDVEDTTETGVIGVHLYGPGEDEEKYFGPLDADRVLLRIIVREGERISGYALVAFWEKQGTTENPHFFSGKVLKEVSFQKKDGIYPEVTLQEVNARLDQAEKDFATEDLFKTSNSILEDEPS